jgi:phage I-like protein
MSSPRTATAKTLHKTLHKTTQKKTPPKAAQRGKPPTRPVAEPVAKPVTKPVATPVENDAAAATASAQALRLAADIERGLADGRLDMLTPEALQALMAAACKAYAAQVEAGNPLAALAQRTTVTPTDVMVTASGLLRATNLAVFELGMWQSWTGR